MTSSEERLRDLFRQVLEEIPNLDLSDPNLVGTPGRLARLYLDWFWGLNPAAAPKLAAFPSHGEGMVGTGRIFFSSVCAHHFLPFTGHAHIFYIPNGKVLGLSKFTRLVQYYAARPQIQERLAVEIVDAIMEATSAHGVFVVLRAVHSCMQCRGVRQEGAVMVTPVIRPINSKGDPVGPFAEVAPRNEALMLMEMAK